MEIGKKKFNKNTKAMLNYCFCVLLFLILNSITVSGHITDFIVGILELDNDIKIAIQADMTIGLCIMIIVWHIYIYITAIFCGIFKKINKLKLYEKILIIFLVNAGLYYFCIGRIYGQQLYAHASLIEAITDYSFWILPVYFLIYKFGGYITKNSVINFEKIEYYMSIEFIVDLYSKIKRNHTKGKAYESSKQTKS